MRAFLRILLLRKYGVSFSCYTALQRPRVVSEATWVTEVQNDEATATWRNDMGRKRHCARPEDAVVGHWKSCRSSSRGALRAVLGLIHARREVGRPGHWEHKRNQASSDRARIPAGRDEVGRQTGRVDVRETTDHKFWHTSVVVLARRPG